jgi:RHH-type rel operon transcriptional repressor/antitoxin RelB
MESLDSVAHRDARPEERPGLRVRVHAQGHGWVQALGAGSLDADRPMRYKYLVALSVRLPEEVEARLDALARKTGRTKTFYVREAIVEHIEDLEDYFLALERMQNPEGDPVSLEDVIARLGLVDSV